MLKKVRRALAEVAAQESQHFADFERIIKRIRNEYIDLFLQFEENKDGSRHVYHFNVIGVFPISLEKEHGRRECIPSKYSKRVIKGIEDVLTFIEANATESQRSDSEKEKHDESSDADEKVAGALPELKIPHGDGGG